MEISEARYEQLMRDGGVLTREEMDAGWHWCWEFDGLLIGPGWIEQEYCNCLEKEDVDNQTNG